MYVFHCHHDAIERERQREQATGLDGGLGADRYALSTSSYVRFHTVRFTISLVLVPPPKIPKTLAPTAQDPFFLQQIQLVKPLIPSLA